jgi:hypothetical protein
MTRPQYVTDLSNVYTDMYNPPGKERPLMEKHSCDEEHDYDIPKWKRLLNQHAKEEESRRAPHATQSHPREDASEDEEHPNRDVGVGSDFANQYIDALELRNQSTGHQAQQYLETIIDDVPTAVGGVNIHSIIKDAFIAGTKAR